MMPRRLPKSILIAIGFAAVLLYLSLRGIDWRGAWDLIRHAKLVYFALGILISSASLFLRALRWRVLLRSQSNVGAAVAFWATAAGYMGNQFLPARAGELVRTVMISSRCALSITFVLTTALSERVSDAITLVAVSAIVLLAMPNPPGWLSHIAHPFAILGICGVLVIVLAPRLESFGHRVLARVPAPAAIRARISELLVQTIRGLRAFHSSQRLLAFLSLTAAIWFLDTTATIVSARALGLDFSYQIAFLLIAGLGLGSALPSTPGYVGIYQFVAVSILVPFGFSRTEAIAYILLAQAGYFLMIGLWGSIAVLGIPKGSVQELSRK